MSRPFAVPVAVLCTLGLAACGSSYTKQDFISQADAICASATTDARAVPPPALTGNASEQLTGLAHYLNTIAPIYSTEAGQLRRLKRPPQSAGDGAELSRFLAAVSQVATSLRALAAAALRQDSQGVADEEAALQANAVGSLAAAYGLRTCGTPSATLQ